MFWCSRWSRWLCRPGGCSPSSGGWPGRWRPSWSPCTESSCPPCWRREATRTRRSPSSHNYNWFSFYRKGSLIRNSILYHNWKDLRNPQSRKERYSNLNICFRTNQSSIVLLKNRPNFPSWPPTYPTSGCDKPALCFFTFLISWLSNVHTEHLSRAPSSDQVFTLKEDGWATLLDTTGNLQPKV